MDNASGLIADAHALLERGSYGRARSLTVLAQEELGKALWIYETFEQAWSTGASEAQEVARLTSDGRRHAVKYMEAFVFGRSSPRSGATTRPTSSRRSRLRRAERLTSRRRRAKQRPQARRPTVRR
ncbi:AbiV family abortive infection protein [Corynebacterium resistens]|uniref:AbiV family abortive infection protein n=1 Tax=Corynebacterium resistens TaxID=258224 RepID=UPI001F3060B8|nr:AbiV family abortive infection protein [Corynebacterium resistens]